MVGKATICLDGVGIREGGCEEFQSGFCCCHFFLFCGWS